MSPNESAEQALPGDRLAKWQEENLELMRKGFDALARMSPAWWKPARGPVGTDPGLSAEAWVDLMADYCRSMSGAVPAGLKMCSYPVPWDALFNGWKRFLAAAPPQAFPAGPGIDPAGAWSQAWQQNQMRFFEAWTACVERIARMCEPGGEGEKQARKNLDACRESSEGLIAAWRKLAGEQTKGFLDFLGSLQDSGSGEGAPGAPRGGKRKRG
jgi:hypothetical protein